MNFSTLCFESQLKCPDLTPLLLNLLVTCGVEEDSLQKDDLYDWQREYYRSLGLKLHEEALSSAYMHQHDSFGRVALDVTTRSADPVAAERQNRQAIPFAFRNIAVNIAVCTLVQAASGVYAKWESSNLYSLSATAFSAEVIPL